MELSQEMDNLDDLMSDRELLLPSLISNLSDATPLQERIDAIRMLIKFMSNCVLTELDETLLQFVMPAIKNGLLQIYEENSSKLKSDSHEVDMIGELQENLEIAINLLHSCDQILDFLNTLGTIQFTCVQSIPHSMAEIILSSFQHCKVSQSLYVGYTNNEVINLFRKCQGVHTKFLKWVEDSLILDNVTRDLFEIVLNTVVAIGEVISDMNLKSMADNWKSYTAIIQKHADILNQKEFDIGLPLKALTQSIKAKIEDILDMDTNDVKQIQQMMKITNFLIKVSLKLCDIFFNRLCNIGEDLLLFCSVLHGYSPHSFDNGEYPNELTSLVKSIYESYHPFLMHLLEKYSSLIISSLQESIFATLGNHFGCVSSLSSIISCLLDIELIHPENIPNTDYYTLMRSVFEVIKVSSTELYISGNVYENLIAHLSAIVLITSGKSYPLFEKLLLSNILQVQFWPAVIATDVWCLVLRNSSLATCLETLNHLLKNFSKLDLPIFTQRPEFIHLRILIWRIYQIVPQHRSLDVLANFKPVECLNIWQVLALSSVPASQRTLLEPLFSEVYYNHEQIPHIETTDFFRLMEILDSVSSMNLNSFGLHSAKICQIIVDLWNFNLSSPTNTGNNFVKYFIRKLCIITKLFMHHFTGNVVLIILAHLKQLSVCSDYKLSIINILNALSFKNVEKSLEQNAILAEIANLLEILIQDQNPVIRQLALEECYTFVQNSPHDQVTNSVIRNLRNTKYDVNSFFQRTPMKSSVSRYKHFTTLGQLKFEHNCIEWSENYVVPRIERPILSSYNMRSTHAVPLKDNKNTLMENNEQHQIKKLKTDNESDEYCEIDSLINSIKTEMKSLAKAAKKENLTQKNISDINYIVTHLRSIAQK